MNTLAYVILVGGMALVFAAAVGSEMNRRWWKDERAERRGLTEEGENQ